MITPGDRVNVAGYKTPATVLSVETQHPIYGPAVIVRLDGAVFGWVISIDRVKKIESE